MNDVNAKNHQSDQFKGYMGNDASRVPQDNIDRINKILGVGSHFYVVEWEVKTELQVIDKFPFAQS